MDLVSMRQKLVSSNIANADTPGYKTQDLDFRLHSSPCWTGSARQAVWNGLATKNDGNNVDLDREARLLAENSMRFNVASTLMRSSIQQVKEAIKEILHELFASLSVSASGMAAQRTRAALLVENIANSETTRTPKGGPYRRKDAVFSTSAVGSEFASELESQMQTGVRVSHLRGSARSRKTVLARSPRCRCRWLRLDTRASTRPKTWWTL